MEKKMTKKELFAELLMINEVRENEMLVEFINREISLLNKKRTSGPTARQIEAQKIGEKIVDMIEANGEPMSVRMIREESEEFAELSTQKVSAILRNFVNDGILKVEKVKSVNFYEIA